MGSNPLRRGADSGTLGSCREASQSPPLSPPRPSPLALALPARRPASRRSPSGPCRSTASARSQGSPGRFDLVGLRWHGSGSVRFSVRVRRRPLGAVARRGRRGRGRRMRARRGAAPPRGWRLGSPDLGRAVERDPVPDHGKRARSPRLVRPQPGAADPPAGRRVRGVSADRAAQRVGRGRVDRRGTRPRTRRRSGSRSSTTRPGRTTTRQPRRRRSCAGSRSTT